MNRPSKIAPRTRVAEAAASANLPSDLAPMDESMGPLELAAYRADWRASFCYRRHVAEAASAREHELLLKKLEEEARVAAQKAFRAAGNKASAEVRKVLAASSGDTQDEPDEDRETFFVRRRPPPPSHPVTPARAAARLIFARMLDSRPELRKAIGSSAPVVLIDIADPQMLDRVMTAWQDTLLLSDATARVMKVGSNHSGKRDDYDVIYISAKDPPKAKDKGERQGEALSALSLALPIIGISPAAETHLPEALLKSRPVRLTFPPLDAATIARVIRVVTGKRCRDLLDSESASRITPDDLIVAIRFDRTPAECMAELRRLVAEKSVHKGGRDISLDELHGMGEAVAWARSTIRDLEAWRRGEITWASLDPGACLVGPPGTGKTLFASCFARAAGLPMIACSLAQWQGTDEGHLGHLLRAMKRDFDNARAQAPCVVFVDEIDSFADRSKVHHAHADYVVECVNGFIAQCDGIAGREGLILLAASNDLSRCDPAILRSGRFNRIIRIGRPDVKDLDRMFRVRLKGRLAGEDLEEICLLALGSTGADVERITNDALRIARHAERPLELADLRRTLVAQEDRAPGEIRRAAVHEAGHLLTEVVLFGDESTLHATIARSGERGGATMRTQPISFAGTYSEYQRRLQVLLAGYAAEEMMFGEPSHGAATDLQQATALAVAMVGSLGIAGPALLLSLARHEDTNELLAYADVRLAARDQLMRALETCRSVLLEHRIALEEIAAKLLSVGRVDGVSAAGLIRAGRSIKGTPRQSRPKSSLTTAPPLAEQLAAKRQRQRRRSQSDLSQRSGR